MLASLTTEADRLRALPQREAEVRYELTDITVADHWATLDSEGRGRFYRNWNVRVYADAQGCQVRFGWSVPGKEAETMARAFQL
jgi:hypothetical protein